MKFGTIILAVLPALATARPSTLDEPSASSIKLSSSSYTGNGCPSGSLSIKASGGTWTSTYSKYNANSGKADQNVRTCNTTLTFQIPSGWQFSLSSIIGRGFAEVEKNMGVTYSNGFSIGGRPQQPAALTLFGPMKGDRTVQHTFESSVYSPCGGKAEIVVNSQIRISAKEGTDGGKGGNSITLDAQDHAVSWKKC